MLKKSFQEWKLILWKYFMNAFFLHQVRLHWNYEKSSNMHEWRLEKISNYCDKSNRFFRRKSYFIHFWNDWQKTLLLLCSIARRCCSSWNLWIIISHSTSYCTGDIELIFMEESPIATLNDWDFFSLVLVQPSCLIQVI